ncbi:MAG: response regulator [candidate division NC10 bacterium]|nr:response regulator [candidate division NC10 bacterium]
MIKKKVLIVDNDRFFLDIVGDFLTEKGYDIRKASDGLEALEKIREEPPEFIILDIILPKIDGGRVCRYMRKDPWLRDIPIIVFSGLAARDLAKLPEITAAAYVAKGPIDIIIDNILAALERVEEKGDAHCGEDLVFGYEGFRPRQMVSELLALKKHHDLLLWNMGEGVMESDSKHRITYINPAGLRMLRRAEKELIGKDIPSAFEPACQGGIKELARALALAERPLKRSFTINQGGKALKLNFANILEDGSFVGLLTIIEDITSPPSPQSLPVP